MAKAKSEAHGPLDRSPSHLLHRALQRALDIYGASTGAGAVTQRQFAVMAAVEAEEGATQTSLVRATGIDRSTLADLAARMISKGLLERERSSLDARANAVRLTEAGRRALEEARPKAVAADKDILALLPTGKREAFLSALRVLATGERKPGAASALEKIKRKRKKAEKAEKKAKKAKKKDKGPPPAAEAA